MAKGTDQMGWTANRREPAMGSKAEKQAAINAHRTARKNLEKASAKTKDVNDEYLAANRRVIDAEKNIPWYRR